MPAGGIWPPRTLRMTFSQVSAPAGMFDSESGVERQAAGPRALVVTADAGTD